MVTSAVLNEIASTGYAPAFPATPDAAGTECVVPAMVLLSALARSQSRATAFALTRISSAVATLRLSRVGLRHLGTVVVLLAALA